MIRCQSSEAAVFPFRGDGIVTLNPSIQHAVSRLREVGQSLAQAIDERDGEGAGFLARRYEQALQEVSALDFPERDALLRETHDWLQEKIDVAIQIQEEIACELKEVETKRKLTGIPPSRGRNGGASCSFVI